MNVERIAVFRALQLGDLLCATPALRALRGGFPSAHITLIGLDWSHQLIQHLPGYLDELVEFPGWPGLPEKPCEVTAVPRFLADMQSREFDLAIQLHGSGQITNPLVRLFGARHTAGSFRPPSLVPNTDLFVEYSDVEHEVCRLLNVLAHLGCPTRGVHLEFAILEADRAAARPISAPYVCIHPGARDLNRRWPPHAFARVADRLAADGLYVVLTGSAAEASTTRKVREAMQHPALDLADQTELGTLAAVLQGAHLLVCNDTGVSHLAAAIGTPSVVVFTTSDPARWAPLDARRHRVVRASARVEDDVEEVLARACTRA